MKFSRFLFPVPRTTARATRADAELFARHATFTMPREPQGLRAVVAESAFDESFTVGVDSRVRVRFVVRIEKNRFERWRFEWTQPSGRFGVGLREGEVVWLREDADGVLARWSRDTWSTALRGEICLLRVLLPWREPWPSTVHAVRAKAADAHVPVLEQMIIGADELVVQEFCPAYPLGDLLHVLRDEPRRTLTPPLWSFAARAVFRAAELGVSNFARDVCWNLRGELSPPLKQGPHAPLEAVHQFLREELLPTGQSPLESTFPRPATLEEWMGLLFGMRPAILAAFAELDARPLLTPPALRGSWAVLGDRWSAHRRTRDDLPLFT